MASRSTFWTALAALPIGVLLGLQLRAPAPAIVGAETPSPGRVDLAPAEPAPWDSEPASPEVDPQSPFDAARDFQAAPPEPEPARQQPWQLAQQATTPAPAPSNTPQAATRRRPPPDIFSFADVAEAVAPAVVTVYSQRAFRHPGEGGGFFDRFFGNRDEAPRVQGHGSGFILQADGLILTNNHVIDGADELKVRLMDGREYEATVVGADDKTDVAVIRIQERGLPTVTLGDSDALRVGEWVLAIGSPFQQALEHSVTAGIISGKGRGNVGLADYEEFLQTDAAINPGNSGGPLINLYGEVVGINTAIATRNGGYQGVSFAIPINFAQEVVAALVRDGRVRRAWLGVSILDVSPDQARELGMSHPEGVVIADILGDDSPAAEAGLHEQDIVLAMDGHPMSNSSLFRNRVSLSRPGQVVDLEILRAGQRQHVAVRLGELDEARVASLQRRAPRVPVPDDAQRSDLGMTLAEPSPELAARFELPDDVEGALVLEVVPGSVADEAGIRVGDVIQRVNRRRIKDLRGFASAVERVDADRPLVLHLKRGERSLYVTLQRPS